MKKIHVLALSAVAAVGTLAVSCQGGSTATPNASLKNETDTISYAYGVQLAQSGLTQYIQQLGVIEDTATYRISLQGAITAQTDPAKKAQMEKELNTKLDSIGKANSRKLSLFLKGLNESFGSSNKDNDAYYQGLQIGGQIKQMSEGFEKQVLDSGTYMNKQAFLSGLIGSIKNEKSIVENAGELVQTKAMANQERAMKRQEAELKVQYAAQVEASEKFLADNKAKGGIVTLPSGVQYKIVKEGRGSKPTASDRVKVNYKGTLIDGTQFDANDGAVFGVGQVIKGWTEVLQLMPAGSRWTVYIPYDQGYGAQQAGTIPPFSTLIFDVELLSIEK